MGNKQKFITLFKTIVGSGVVHIAITFHTALIFQLS